LEEIKGRGPRECVFVLHRFCTDLEEYYVSVASKHFSPYLFLRTVPVAKRHGCEPDAPVTSAKCTQRSKRLAGDCE
jgi:hypothetical protein